MGIKNTKTYKRGFKDGWEQCKREAVAALIDMADTHVPSFDAIANMEYKGENK